MDKHSFSLLKCSAFDEKFSRESPSIRVGTEGFFLNKLILDVLNAILACNISFHLKIWLLCNSNLSSAEHLLQKADSPFA